MIPDIGTPVLVHGMVARIETIDVANQRYELISTLDGTRGWFVPDVTYLYILTEKQAGTLLQVLTRLRLLQTTDWNSYLSNGPTTMRYQNLVSQATQLIHEIQVSSEWADPPNQ